MSTPKPKIIEAAWKPELREAVKECKGWIDHSDLGGSRLSFRLDDICNVLLKLIDHVHVDGEEGDGKR